MPVVLVVNGFRFFFYSNENFEPLHIHVQKAEGNAKYWLEPELEEVYSYGFTIGQRRSIQRIVNENREFLIEKWYEYFK